MTTNWKPSAIPCAVRYTDTSWGSGFSVNITITDAGCPVNQKSRLSAR